MSNKTNPDLDKASFEREVCLEIGVSLDLDKANSDLDKVIFNPDMRINLASK